MSEQHSRTEALIGKDGLGKLKKARVLVFGIGGVGGYAVEALTRAGIGMLGLCDGDTVALSNLNRQLYATHKTININKVDAAAERIKDIAPLAVIVPYPFFYTAETAGLVDLGAFDYIVDAIDNVPSKIELILNAQATGVPIVSCMGTGNKLNPGGFITADIYETSVCPLAKVMRSELKKCGVKNLTVVYSKEPPTLHRIITDEKNSNSNPGQCKKHPPASISFVPAAAGLVLAGKVINDLLSMP